MIRIRPVYSRAQPADRSRVRQAQQILRESFPSEADHADLIPTLLAEPTRFRCRSVLLVAEDTGGQVKAFALVSHFPDSNTTFLDFLAARKGIRGGGLGGAVYEAAREYALAIGSAGLLMEVWPDDPEHLHDQRFLAENRRRLRFYERYGARPVVGTDYEKHSPNPPEPPAVLVYDPLNGDRPLSRRTARKAIRDILEHKYGHVAPPGYIDRIVKSVRDDPVRLRELRYRKAPVSAPKRLRGRLVSPFAAVVCRRHVLHHVPSRGYVERPARVETLKKAIEGMGLFEMISPRRFGLDPILAVHDKEMVDFLRTICRRLAGKAPYYPDVFPATRDVRKPKDKFNLAGYYCLDAFTPLTANVYTAARAAVNVALTAAEEVRTGRRVAYALCRPPGHHAGRETFGGFCYFNNAAIAAEHLLPAGKVAILDLDLHHGNGTQEIFYRRSDVLTVSLHANPDGEYPYFSGFAAERGDGDGRGHNRNFPLPNDTGPEAYLAAADKALTRVKRHRPAYLLVSLGLDTLRGDPTGQFQLTPKSLRSIGRKLAEVDLPLLIIQEGGYNLRNLQSGATQLFLGLAEGITGLTIEKADRPGAAK
jgi:acetoin utilization deacetylase AcuC-like enzyme/GNAT superfamily N-acetyltransferase